jgi:aminoglycoside phosphotransferase (APT) family kinase protein
VPGGAGEFARQKATTADYHAAWPRFVAEFGQHASARALAVGERLGESVDAVVRALEQRPQTLAHADYRADNFFFDQGVSDAPMIVIDWQLAMWTAGSYDIAYIVGGSLPAADRAGLHDEVVRRWHGHLTAHGVNDYTVEQAWGDYRLGMVLALTALVTFSHALATGGARGQALGAVLTERLFGALAECAIDPASLPF